MTTIDWMRKNRNNYATRKEAEAACVKATGCTPRTATDAYYIANKRDADARYGKGSKKDTTEVDTDVLNFIPTVDEKLYDIDIPAKIRRHIHDLGERIPTDAQFREYLCQNASAAWSNARDLPEFSKYQYRHNKTLYWGLPESLERFKRALKGQWEPKGDLK